MIPTLTWYLEMITKPSSPVLPLPEGFFISDFNQGTVKDGATNISNKNAESLNATSLRNIYLEIYKAVGGNFNWYDRILMPAGKLDAILNDKATEIQLLKYGKEMAGFVEFSHLASETEIVYFGLTPEFTGRKAGLPFLHWAVNHAWEKDIRRLWLHTCDLDHPAALPLYQKAGFVVYKTETIMQPVIS